MAKKTVITSIKYGNPEEGVLLFPQNSTLYATQLTEDVTGGEKDRVPFKAHNMQEVFEYYEPCISDIPLTAEDGGTTEETFSFREISDFDDKALIENSEQLSADKEKADAYDSIIRELEQSKTLRKVLRDKAMNGNLKNALKALLAELEEAE